MLLENWSMGPGEVPKGMKGHCKKTDQQVKPWYAQ